MEDDGSADTDTNKQIFVMSFERRSRMIGAIILQVILIALNAVFTCAETAIVSLNDNQLEEMAKKGMKQKQRFYLDLRQSRSVF